MKSVRFLLLVIIICMAASVLTGCAATQVAPVKKERYFWPPLPDIPRIEFIGVYTGQDSLKEAASGFLDILIGDEANQVLLGGPLFIAADGAGLVYVSDQKSGGVFRFDLKGKTAFILGGEASSKLIARPTGVSLDGDGNVYTADAQQKKIYVQDKSGNVSLVMDLSKYVVGVGGIAVDKVRKRLVVADLQGHKIVLLGLDGSYINEVGKRGQGDAEFNYPTAVAVDREGTIVVADSMNSRIQRLTPDLKFINAFGKRGDGIGEMAVIKGVACDSEGHIYVTDGKMNKIMIFNNQGEILLQFGGSYTAVPGASIGPGGFRVPQGIFIDQNDTIYVVDQMNARFHVYQYMNERYVKENPY